MKKARQSSRVTVIPVARNERKMPIVRTKKKTQTKGLRTGKTRMRVKELEFKVYS